MSGERFECSLHGVVSAELEDLAERLKYICIESGCEYRAHVAHAVSLHAINPQQTRMRITRILSENKEYPNQWKMDYIGNPPMHRTEVSKHFDPDLVQSVLIRPTYSSYVSPAPFSMLPSLGFMLTSEFVREGMMFTDGKVDCMVTQLHSLTVDGDPNITIPYDPLTSHVELSIVIGKGVNFRTTIEELVRFGQQLHPYVTFTQVNLREAYKHAETNKTN